MNIHEEYREAKDNLPEEWKPTTNAPGCMPLNHIQCELLFAGGGRGTAELVSDHRGGRYWGNLAFGRWHFLCGITGPIGWRVVRP